MYIAFLHEASLRCSLHLYRFRMETIAYKRMKAISNLDSF